MQFDYLQIFRCSPASLLIIDRYGVVIKANDAALVLLGYVDSEIEHLPFFKLQPHSKGQTHTSPTALNALAESDGSFETLIQRKNGGQFPAIISCNSLQTNIDSPPSPQHTRPSNEINYFIIRLDKNTENKMQESSRILGKAMAETSNQEKSDFLSVMSHEIRTPIQGTIGALDLLELKIEDVEQRHFLDLARTSADSLLRIVDDVLDFDSIEANALKLQPQRFDLYSLIESLVAIYQPQRALQNNSLSVTIHPNTPQYIYADEGRVRQIFSNYLSNANKFTVDGHIRMELNFTEDNQISFQVFDDGCGVELELKDKIFTKFARGNHKYLNQGSFHKGEEHHGKLTHRSTGLGLAICKQLARLMGGQVGFSSTPNQGSRFWFRFAPPLHEDQISEIPSPPSNDLYVTHENKIILVVEDSEINREIFSAMLCEHKFHIIAAEHGKQAVERYIEFKPDIIIMDLQMPVMDGYEATRIIRQLESRPHPSRKNSPIPIIAMTADVLGDVQDRCRLAGLSDYISKPIDREKLLHKIDAWLERRHSAITDEVEIPKQTVTSGIILDKEFLARQFLQVRPESIDRMINIYIKETEARLESLAKSLEIEDFDTLMGQSHVIKSSSGSFGATRLSHEAANMEVGAKKNQILICQESFTRLNAAYKATITELKTYAHF